MSSVHFQMRLRMSPTQTSSDSSVVMGEIGSPPEVLILVNKRIYEWTQTEA